MSNKRLVCVTDQPEKVWILNESKTDLIEFTPTLAPGWSSGPLAIWGDDYGRLITHGAGSNAHHLEGGVWVAKPASSARFYSIHGTSYNNVWAVNGDTQEVWHWDGSVWTKDADLAGSRVNDVAAWGPGLDQVIAVANDGVWIRTGGAIGSGVWTNQFTNMMSDIGVTPDSSTDPQWVVTFGASLNIIGLPRSASSHCIVRGGLGGWSIASGPSPHPRSVIQACAAGASAAAVYYQSRGTGGTRLMVFDGSTCNEEENVGGNYGGDVAIVQGSVYHINELNVNQFSLWEGPGTYTRIVFRVESGLNQSMGLAAWESQVASPPYASNQSPAPSSTGNAADTDVYVEAVDDDDDLVASTVVIYINGTVAWASEQSMPGFTGTAVAVTNGLGYTVQPAGAFEPGMQTVRITGEDVGGRTVDETWTFDTVAVVEEADETGEEVSDQDPPIGIDLKLDTSRDIYVEDYDLVLVTGADEVAQHLLVGLLLFRGEWFLDEEAGIPYYQHIFVAAPNSRVIEGLFRQDILGDADVEALTVFEMDINRATRKLDIDFTAVSKIGEVNVSSVLP